MSLGFQLGPTDNVFCFHTVTLSVDMGDQLNTNETEQTTDVDGQYSINR